ncbi:MAG: efflux RND transporter periplasmic adaptor subunit, partial [Halofilum sp. (in: g-proteobacteria)]
LSACSQDDDGSQADAAGQAPPPTVQTATVSLEDVDVREEYAGRIHGAREVQVRARVEGIVSRRTYNEGAYVEAGEQLFQIDPEPFGVALARSQAERQRAQASVRQAQRDWDRVSSLYEDDAISTRERDQAQSALELARAELAVADTAVQSAEIELSYTRVDAPVAGVTSLEVLPEGGLANRGDLLTTVTQLDPMHVRFSLPESDALAQGQARRAMAGEAVNGSREVALLLPNGERYDESGEVDFTEAGIDPATGTVRTRAVFPNPDRLLRPGMFVRVEIRTATLEGVAVVPEAAVASSGDGPTLFVIGDDNVASAVPVELGPVVPDGQVVASGLDEGDRVVVSGLAGLSDGMEVNPGGGNGDGEERQ